MTTHSHFAQPAPEPDMTPSKRTRLFLILLVLMAITRAGHFGSVVSLPDASLAIFLLGGFWLGAAGYFAAFAALGFGIDVSLAKTAVEAGWCLTPAYGGLVAGYGVMWLAGRWLARTPELPPLRFVAVSLGALFGAFLIANISFWGLSGYFDAMALSDYASRVARYFPAYLASTSLYLGTGWIAQRLMQARKPALA
jgi:hypothetical protein